MIDLVPRDIENYALEHSGVEDAILRELREETYAKMSVPQMLSGFLQGRLLYLLTKLVHAERALEIGMFTGYASICIARGLALGGNLTCLEMDENVAAVAERFFKRAGLENTISILKGDARENLARVRGPLDFVFIDADKENYLHYFEAVIERVRSGGLIVADNTLWGGAVLKPQKEQDATTQAIVTFNDKTSRDPRVETVLLPIRDGLLLLRKK